MAEENQNSSSGLARFECGSGNTMTIEFPEVTEAEAHMNIGIALMPFMKDGFQFIKEDGITNSQASEGLNRVEVSFVKYLYEIRKNNRDKTTLEYSMWHGPSSNSERQRVFIAGTIFPIMNIFYSGDDINCSDNKIKIKSVTFSELRNLFGETFDEYKAYSINYISIDDDKIKIFLPKFTEVGIYYDRLLLDFLKNGSKTQSVASHGEFPDLETYTLATDQTSLQSGCWLTEDREDNSSTWKTACMYILENKLQGVLAPFAQIADFYDLLQIEIEDETTHLTRWLKGARKLVGSLAFWMEGQYRTNFIMSNDVETILNELNIGICNYAITQFYELFYGKYLNDPLNTLEKAYQFDLKFVKHEQGVVAVPIYAKTSEDAIKAYQKMADQNGVVGYSSGVFDKVVPEFDLWDGSVTDAQFRIDLPMLMLWLDRHKPTGQNFADKVDSNGFLLKDQKEIIRKYEAK